MANLVAPHAVDRDTEHYAAVKAEMETRGECKIRALWSEDLGYWFAIEGSHRCAAAAELGIEIEIHDIGNGWEWLTDYLVSVANVNENPVYDAVEP